MRLTLTEERNAVMVPSAGSGIPGAPAEWYEHTLPYARTNVKMMHGLFLAWIVAIFLLSLIWPLYTLYEQSC